MNDKFIKQLAQEGAKPPILKPQKQLFLWFVISFLYALILLFFFGLRKDLAIEIKNISFVFEALVIAAFSLSSAFYANVSALPDLNQNYNLRKIPLIFLAILLALVLFKFLTQKTELEIFCGGESYFCAIAILVFATIPSLLFFVILRNGVSTNLKNSGLFIGLSSGSFSYLILRLIHETEEIHHLFFWHFLPIFLVSLLTIICANFCLKKI